MREVQAATGPCTPPAVVISISCRSGGYVGSQSSNRHLDS
jgi:hypothetical protein